MSLHKIKAAVDAAKGNARQMGEVVLMIAQADEHAAEVIAADLDNPEMSLQKCFDALYEHAKKNQKGGFWGCMFNRYDPDNPVIQVVAEFYKVNLSEAQREGALGHKISLDSQAIGSTEQIGENGALRSAHPTESGDLDLMDLL